MSCFQYIQYKTHTKIAYFHKNTIAKKLTNKPGFYYSLLLLLLLNLNNVFLQTVSLQFIVTFALILCFHSFVVTNKWKHNWLCFTVLQSFASFGFQSLCCDMAEMNHRNDPIEYMINKYTSIFCRVKFVITLKCSCNYNSVDITS